MSDTFINGNLTSLRTFKIGLYHPSVKLGERTYDEVVNNLISSVSKSFAVFCNRKGWEKQTETEYFDGGGNVVAVSRLPVDSVTSFYIDGDREYTSTESSDDYSVSENGIIEYDGYITEGNRKIKVVYVGGYTADATEEENIPDDLNDACCLQVAHLLNLRLKGATSTTEVKYGDGKLNMIRTVDYLPEVVAVLREYEIPLC